jgi:hypothetical protein
VITPPPDTARKSFRIRIFKNNSSKYWAKSHVKSQDEVTITKQTRSPLRGSFLHSSIIKLEIKKSPEPGLFSFNIINLLE